MSSRGKETTVCGREGPLRVQKVTVEEEEEVHIQGGEKTEGMEGQANCDRLQQGHGLRGQGHWSDFTRHDTL